VERVTKGDQVIYGETLVAPEPVLDPKAANNLAYALSQVSAAKTNFGWDTAGKTGTWELPNSGGENAHAWMVGYSRSIATAVWVGNRGDEKKLRDANDNKIGGAGLPASIWRQFMAGAAKAINDTGSPKEFNNPNGGGDLEPSGAVPSPTPSLELPPGWPPGWPTIPGWPPTQDAIQRD
jgi:membrane peptidoglycan carboxypeptidase